MWARCPATHGLRLTAADDNTDPDDAAQAGCRPPAAALRPRAGARSNAAAPWRRSRRNARSAADGVARRRENRRGAAGVPAMHGAHGIVGPNTKHISLRPRAAVFSRACSTGVPWRATAPQNPQSSALPLQVSSTANSLDEFVWQACSSLRGYRFFRLLIQPTITRTTPGQNVKNASMPSPTGFGFGSFVKPSAASVMTPTNGPAPSTRTPTPNQKSFDMAAE